MVVDTPPITLRHTGIHERLRYSYDQVYPIGQLVALSAIGHKNKEVAEFGIKCYENWGHPEGVEKLKATSFSTPWLREYADQVIADLSEG